ncbi:MAG: hypothetical protein RL670_243 [Actinomycetota bacterium]|jgi:integral membrane protein
MATKTEQISSALKLYKVAARITGTLLLLLVLEMVVRYGFGYDLWAAGPQGFLALVEHSEQPGAMPTTGLNLSTAVLVVHGWFYVLYLYADFRVWTLLRWSFFRFLVIAAGGVVPFLSFFTEHYYAKIGAADLEALEKASSKAGA